MSKEGLQKVIQQEQVDSDSLHGNSLSTEDLRDLFTSHENVRSEIHDNLNCTRCQVTNQMLDNDTENMMEVSNGRDSTTGTSPCSQIADDIGGFAEIAGCFQRLKSSERQIGTPLEEDMGSWGHHFDPSTIPDAILQASAGDEVTFVFTNQVDGKLVPVESAVRSTNLQATEQIGQIKKKERGPSPLLRSEQCPKTNQSPRIVPAFKNRSAKLVKTSPSGGIHEQRKAYILSTHAATDATDDDFV